ncbi:MAG: hypothetical protein HY519_02510, partial [Candidatus Aenigmarchaeota archaeon]|nr:hypothetical protein [Candidatus Aenigmarchaeota archaeon]
NYFTEDSKLEERAEERRFLEGSDFVFKRAWLDEKFSTTAPEGDVFRFIDSDGDGSFDGFERKYQNGYTLKLEGDDFQTVFKGKLDVYDDKTSQFKMLRMEPVSYEYATDKTYYWADFREAVERNFNHNFGGQPSQNYYEVKIVDSTTYLADTDNNDFFDTISSIKGMQFVDHDEDGSWDIAYVGYVGTDGATGGVYNFYGRGVFFQDKLMTYGKCRIPGLKVTLENKDKFKGQVDYNFCYNTKSGAGAVVGDIVLFFADGLVSRLGAVGYFASTAAHCYLAYSTATGDTKSWPGDKWK